MSAATTTATGATNNATGGARQAGGDLYVACTLQGQAYLAPAALVREVSVVGAVTPVPRTPAWFRGVMNLRGAIVGVVDLALLLGVSASPAPRALALVCPHDDASIALMVDAVGEMQWLAPAELLPVAEPDGGPAPEGVCGYYQTVEGPVRVLDLARVLGSLDLSRESVSGH